VMGEAGPEAILPLKRGAGGVLGVQSASSARELRIEVVNPPGRPLEARAEPGNSPDAVRIMLSEVAKDIGTGGQVARAMQGTFGLNRAAGAPRRG